MGNRSGLETAGDFFTVLWLVGMVVLALCYCAFSRPGESWGSFNTRLKYGEFRSPAIRAMMDRDPECRARMEALLTTGVFRRAVSEVESTRSRLWWAVEDARHFAGRANETAATAEAAREPGVDDTGGGSGDGSDGVAGARARLLAASGGEDRATARRVAELTTKHEEAKSFLATLISAVAVYPQSGRNRDPGRALVAIREGVEGVHNHTSAVAATSGEASRRFARGAGGAGAAVDPMEISGAATSRIEEGRPSQASADGIFC